MSQDTDTDTLSEGDLHEAVAIIGWAGRYPGAPDIDTLWQNLRDGVESIRFFSRDELLAAGLPAELIDRPDYVPAKGQLDGVELFDASFFGYTPREATVMDPQQRLFLECAWEALENAGQGATQPGTAVGVYACSSINTYLLRNWNTEQFRALDGLELLISSEKDFLATRVAYKLDLRGPAVTVQTACSSSLSAVCTAAQALLDFQCDIALAGGASVNNPRVGGYVYRQGAIMSPDGHCRAFDADAGGTVSGEGLGIVVLKRLSEAVAARDTIHAVIRGFALNNDGANKIGYTAPSVDGQAEVIRMAQAFAGVGPDDIGYVEAHGTGTDLGDPIEITALTQAFRAGTAQRGYCGVGSVKTNFGHTDAAAGVTGLIKAALSLEKGEIPPTLHFQRPNPHIDFAASPFFVVDRLLPWPRSATPRRAAVSAFGIGGTNAHAVLEEAPLPTPLPAGRAAQLLVLSARSEAALGTACQRLAARLENEPGLELADVAQTLQSGRRAFDWRVAVVATDSSSARQALARNAAGGGRKLVVTPRPVAFAFTGQGAQYPGMAAGLYRDEPVFRSAMDECLTLLRERAGLDLAPLLYPALNDDAAAAALRDTRHAQPALFATSWSLARLWQHWGVVPDAMIGHSIGEYVAACLAGVMSLGDALELVALRGRLVAGLPTGSMLMVPLPEAQLRPLLRPALAIAAINAPGLCVVSGETPAIEALEAELRSGGLDTTRLHTSHAFHSRMLDPVLDEFGRAVGRLWLSAPTLPYLSNVSGQWIRPEEATDPNYWVRHLREAVRFSDGAALLLEDPARVVLEVGPGATLTGLVRQHLPTAQAERALATLRAPREDGDDRAFVLGTLGRLWQGGVAVDWAAVAADEPRRRVPLPSYPFERRRFWIEPGSDAAAAAPAAPQKRSDVADWTYVPSWRQAPLAASALATAATATRDTGPWLVFGNGDALETALLDLLRGAGASTVTVHAGSTFSADKAQAGDSLAFTVDPASDADHDRLWQAITAAGLPAPTRVLHLWTAGLARTAGTTEAVDRAFWSPSCTVRACGRGNPPARLLFVSADALPVLPGEPVRAEAGLLAGPAGVGPREYAQLATRHVDIQAAAADPARTALHLLAEMADLGRADAQFAPVAWRGGQRWRRGFEPTPLPVGTLQLPANALVLVTGGLGGIGLALARTIANACPGVRLVLTGRSALPPADSWAALAAANGTEPRLARRLTALLALQAAGATVETAAVDVADEAAMAGLLSGLRQRHGALHGVVHAAGLPAGGVIELKTRAAADAILAPKVQGTRILQRLLAAGPAPAFVVLCSSLTATMASAGQVDYTAANAFQDAAALELQAAGVATAVAVQWDSWSESGMAVEAELPPALAELRRQSLAAGLTDAEGGEVFTRALAAGLPQLWVSTRELAARLAGPALPQPASPAAAQAGDDTDATAAAVAVPTADARAGLSAAYVAPRTETERLVAAAWQDLFGITQMGVHDNFFEADGHSLLAIQIVARIARDLGVRLPANALFESPTIDLIAQRVDTERNASASSGADDKQLADALAMVEQLSDEEVARLLSEDPAPR